MASMPIDGITIDTNRSTMGIDWLSMGIDWLSMVIKKSSLWIDGLSFY
jgi:hypothetical protein